MGLLNELTAFRVSSREEDIGFLAGLLDVDGCLTNSEEDRVLWEETETDRRVAVKTCIV